MQNAGEGANRAKMLVAITLVSIAVGLRAPNIPAGPTASIIEAVAM